MANTTHKVTFLDRNRQRATLRLKNLRETHNYSPTERRPAYKGINASTGGWVILTQESVLQRSLVTSS